MKKTYLFFFSFFIIFISSTLFGADKFDGEWKATSISYKCPETLIFDSNNIKIKNKKATYVLLEKPFSYLNPHAIQFKGSISSNNKKIGMNSHGINIFNISGKIQANKMQVKVTSTDANRKSMRGCEVSFVRIDEQEKTAKVKNKYLTINDILSSKIKGEIIYCETKNEYYPKVIRIGEGIKNFDKSYKWGSKKRLYELNNCSEYSNKAIAIGSLYFCQQRFPQKGVSKHTLLTKYPDCIIENHPYRSYDFTVDELITYDYIYEGYSLPIEEINRIAKAKDEEKRKAEAKKKEEEAKQAQDNILKPISKPEF